MGHAVGDFVPPWPARRCIYHLRAAGGVVSAALPTSKSFLPQWRCSSQGRLTPYIHATEELMSLLDEIRSDLINESANLSNTLRKAKIGIYIQF